MIGVRTPWRDAIAVLGVVAATPLRRLIPQLAGGLVAAVVVYVPLHELLHALGCLAVGGTVTRVEIAPLFAGAILARALPVVSPDTGYAGRLSGFDVGGSDLRLLATDFAPYLLTIFVGVPLVRHLRDRPRAGLVPAAWLLALAPWMNLPGDYYEMGSVAVTAALALAGHDWSALRSDDLPRLCAALWSDPAALGAVTLRGKAAAVGVVAGSLALGLALAGLTYHLGHLVAEGLGLHAGGRRPPTR